MQSLIILGYLHKPVTALKLLLLVTAGRNAV